MPVYLVFLIIFFALPVLILGWLKRKAILRYKRTLLWCLISVFTFGALWDWLSVRTGVWHYDSAKTLGIWLCGLSIEEFVGFYLLGTLLIFLVVLTVSDLTLKKQRK